MGLEGVEIVMRIEEAFGIEITELEAVEIRTPRHLIDLVSAKIASVSNVSGCLSQKAFYQLRRGLIDSLNLPRNRIRPESRLSELIPSHMRRRTWQALKQNSNLSGLPDLTAGWPLILASGVAGYFIAYHAAGFVFPQSVTLWTYLLALICWPAVFLFTRPLHVGIPDRCESVGDLAKYVSNYHPKALSGDKQALSPHQIATTVRAIVGDQFGVKEFSDDADFIYDLGMD